MDISSIIRGYRPDGVLPDGGVIEYKSKIPADNAIIGKTIVAVANYGGGLLVYGVKEMKDGLEVCGVTYGNLGFMSFFSRVVRELTSGIHFHVEEQLIDGKLIVVVTIDAAAETSYFTRSESSPERQIEYTFEKDENGKLQLVAKAKLQYKNVFKYMTLEAFITSMYCGSWRFFEPSKWNDRFEQRFYCAKYNVKGAVGNTPQLFATCVTREKNSEAAWKVYSHGQGLGMHCVQLELDIAKLRSEIRKSGLVFEERPVTYDNEGYITTLHQKKNPKSGYKKFFVPFTRNSFLRLLSLKRDAYSYEKEVRLFVIRKNPSQKRNLYRKAEHEDIKMDWCSIIKSVRVDKSCTPAELMSIQKACFEVGIEPDFKGFTLPCSLSPTKPCKKIEFVAFNIDDMPGTSRITIN